jgi:hypothetical protein
MAKAVEPMTSGSFYERMIFFAASTGELVSAAVQLVYVLYPLTWGLSSAVFFFYYKRANWLNQIRMNGKEG